ncbi:hypothetical protein T484DRAFT_1855019 [Baffinella frigidus]|nr:hypothetical protein T484DRAFT_1855019 [Cryptophyta sp. CCMP2293]
MPATSTKKHTIKNMKPGTFPKETFHGGPAPFGTVDNQWQATETHCGFLYFKAGTPSASGPNISLLSNLATVKPFNFDGHVFQSSEAAYMAQRLHTDSKYRLSIKGDLGSFKNMRLTEKSIKWWKKLPFNNSKKKNGDEKDEFWHKNRLSGIISKQATKPESASSLGLQMSQGPRPNKAHEWDIWREILLAKYTADTAARTALLATDNCLLVETAKSLARKTKPGGTPETSKWGGLVKDGVLLGENTMGRYLCRVRTILKG